MVEHANTIVDAGTILAVIAIGITLWRVNRSSRDRLQDKITELYARVGRLARIDHRLANECRSGLDLS